MESSQVEHVNLSERWRRAVVVRTIPALRFRKVAYRAVRNEEREQLIIQGTTSIRDDKNSEIQRHSATEISEFPPDDSSCPGTSPETFYTCSEEPEEDDDDPFSHKALHRRNSSSVRIRMDETDNDYNLTPTNVEPVNSGDNENGYACGRRDGSKIKVLEWIFPLANFFVELMSIAFDQLSSQHKAPFMLLCLIMSIVAVLISVSELVYNLWKEKAIRKKVGRCQRRLCDQSSEVHLVSFPDTIALICGFGQFIITTVNYCWYRKQGNVPIKVSIWPAFFAFGMLCSKFWAARLQRGTSG